MRRMLSVTPSKKESCAASARLLNGRKIQRKGFPPGGYSTVSHKGERGRPEPPPLYGYHRATSAVQLHYCWISMMPGAGSELLVSVATISPELTM